MEIKIKDHNQLIDATIEVVDGVMIVSPKEEKVDITKFKDGDIITCGWSTSDKKCYNWTCILHGEIEYISDNMFIDDYCSLDYKGEFLDHNSGSDSATWVRYATEEEKKKLFDRLKEEGYEWDADKKELVKLRLEPKANQHFFFPSLEIVHFKPQKTTWIKNWIDFELNDKGWVFPTKEECDEFCKKLNQAIEGIKP